MIKTKFIFNNELLADFSHYVKSCLYFSGVRSLYVHCYISALLFLQRFVLHTVLSNTNHF